MNVSRAFTFAFDDRDWPVKLLATLAVTLGTVVLVPVLVGFVLWAVLLSYQADVLRRVRAGQRGLPVWGDIGGRVQRGAPLLAATLVYNLPNILLGCCFWGLSPALGQTFTGTGVTLVALCCLVPVLLAYNLAMSPVLALGIARYADERRAGVLFEVGTLGGLARRQQSASVAYLLAALLANIVFVFLVMLIGIGWLMIFALFAPVHGFLMGEYAARVLGRPAAPPPARQPLRAPYRQGR